MNGRTIARLHKVLGIGMDVAAVDELAGDHIESEERRQGLTVRGHTGFFLNNLVRRIFTPASSDMGAHFLPALVVTGAGIVVYVAGGKGAGPHTHPAWPMLPMAVGLIWLIVQTTRANGFPARSGVIPALIASGGALADAIVMPMILPEDNFIRAGLVVLAASGSSVFLLLARRPAATVSWATVRTALAGDAWLRLAWRLLSVGLGLIAFGEAFAWSRFQLANTMQVGAVLMGIGMAWMAASFYVAGRPAPTPPR